MSVEIEHKIENYLSQTKKAWNHRNALRSKKSEHCLISSCKIADSTGIEVSVVEDVLSKSKSAKKAFKQTTLYKRNIYMIL